jgi:hypothetical protein
MRRHPASSKGKINETEARRRIERGRLQAHGGDRRSDQADNTKKDINLKGHGTSRSYTLARLDRDRPNLAAKVDAKITPRLHSRPLKPLFEPPPKDSFQTTTINARTESAREHHAIHERDVLHALIAVQKHQSHARSAASS